MIKDASEAMRERDTRLTKTAVLGKEVRNPGPRLGGLSHWHRRNRYQVQRGANITNVTKQGRSHMTNAH